MRRPVDPAQWLEARRHSYTRYADLIAQQAVALDVEDYERIGRLDQEQTRLAEERLADEAPAGLEAEVRRSPHLASLWAEADRELARALALDRAYRRALETVLERTRAELAEFRENEPAGRGYGNPRALAGAALDLVR